MLLNIIVVGLFTSCICRHKYELVNGYYIVKDDFLKLDTQGHEKDMLDNARFRPSHVMRNNEKFDKTKAMGYFVFYKDGRFINYYDEIENLNRIPKNSIYYGKYFIEKNTIILEKIIMNQPPSKCYSRKIIKGKISSDSLILNEDGVEKFYLKY